MREQGFPAKNFYELTKLAKPILLCNMRLNERERLDERVDKSFMLLYILENNLKIIRMKISSISDSFQIDLASVKSL